MDKDNDIMMNGIDERIEAFLRGSMSAEEEAIFKQEIKSNPELRNRAMTMASLIKGIQAKEAEREKEIIHSTTNASKSKIRPLMMWACSTAAVFVIIFGVYKEHRYRTLEGAVSPYYIQYDAEDISRGEADSAAIVHLYNLFTQIQDKRNVSDIIEELEPIYNSLENDITYYTFANDIAWNLALAYVKDDQTDKAVTILQKLKDDNPDTPFYKKADELLEKISEM